MVGHICPTGAASPAIVWTEVMDPFSRRTLPKTQLCTFTTRIFVACFRWSSIRKSKRSEVFPDTDSPRISMCSLRSTKIRTICASVHQVHHVHLTDCLTFRCANTVSDFKKMQTLYLLLLLVLDSPILLSFPHFYLADESFRLAVDGISPPEKEKHQLFIDVQPVIINWQKQLGTKSTNFSYGKFEIL